ncbi:hypothetical protein K491DRAFT_676456 [Lophiostoma macrostomum CBS 122681]|uniref:Uncharacterized protein n=1 Tax=Lophiostoma macrostomum CBS 122681 TaxID=1314788 RepID=A0A6A6THM2_9PLEO|nr:hypothetical protein K491DRAFT_676456 [Lophiostoma macrostomum CBS 122681]
MGRRDDVVQAEGQARRLCARQQQQHKRRCRDASVRTGMAGCVSDGLQAAAGGPEQRTSGYRPVDADARAPAGTIRVNVVGGLCKGLGAGEDPEQGVVDWKVQIGKVKEAEEAAMSGQSLRLYVPTADLRQDKRRPLSCDTRQERASHVPCSSASRALELPR